jgi:hypothetical protein
VYEILTILFRLIGEIRKKLAVLEDFYAGSSLPRFAHKTQKTG